MTAIMPYGRITGMTVTNAGSGYTSAPTVTFSGGLGPGGIPAQATAVISGGSVTEFTFNGNAVGATINDGGSPPYIYQNNIGQNYTSTPTVTLSGGGGSGATATATFGLNGTGYTLTPTVEIIGGEGSGATATANVTGSGAAATVTSYTITAGGSGYTLTGRSANDHLRLFGGFTLGNGSVNVWVAQACAMFNIPVDICTEDFYINNQPHGYGGYPDGTPIATGVGSNGVRKIEWTCTRETIYTQSAFSVPGFQCKQVFLNGRYRLSNQDCRIRGCTLGLCALHHRRKHPEARH